RSKRDWSSDVCSSDLLTLQSLVNGIRSGLFELDHPAHNWHLNKKWNDNPTDDLDLAYFDEEWSWFSSYGTWRAALMVYLYPENRSEERRVGKECGCWR